MLAWKGRIEGKGYRANGMDVCLLMMAVFYLVFFFFFWTCSYVCLFSSFVLFSVLVEK